MSVLQCPDAFDMPQLQIWNNAAFENGESEDTVAVKDSWPSLGSIRSSFMNNSLESDCSKENRSPILLKTPSVSVKPLWPRNVLEPFQEKPSLGKPRNVGVKEDDKKRDEKNIDSEIDEIEKEIGRLSSKLETLRLEKAEHQARSVAMKGRLVPAKFMEAKHSSIKNIEPATKFEDPLFSSAKKSKLNRRGVSLGPAEIFSATKSKQSMKHMMTPPVPSVQSRRKSCFFKLQEIEEGKVATARERGKSLSLSPKSRKTVSKVQATKQAATTVGSKRPTKKEDTLLATIQPKKLFKDAEKSAMAKKSVKAGRMVASRYTQVTNQSNGNHRSVNDNRKRSLPDNENDESKRFDKRRVSKENAVELCKGQKSENRVKKKWEIPSEVVLKGESPQSISKVENGMPKIKIVRWVGESPRDSGAAKRVAELEGRRSYFGIDEEGESEEEEAEYCVRQSLCFEEGDDDEDEEELGGL